jgi:hypothetical protein
VAVVGPLRALAVARGQALYNQLRREAGGAGVAGGAIVAVVVPFALAAPTIGAYLVGSSLGAVIPHPERGTAALSTLSGFLLFIPLGLGFLAGILGEDEEAGAPLRVYPVSRRERLAARFLSSALGLGPLLAFASLLGLGAGLSVARLAFAPVALLLCAQSAVFVLIVQHFVRGARSAGLARLGFALSALAVVGLAVLLKTTGRPLLSGAAAVLQSCLAYAPATFGAQGLLDIALGRFAAGWLRQLLPLAVTVLAIEAAARHAARLELGECGVRARDAGRERLWSFNAPAHAIARIFVSSVARSRHGRTLFLMPGFLAMMLVVLGSAIEQDLRTRPLPEAIARRIPALESLPVFGIVPFLVCHMNSDLWLNQWGWDGRVVRTLFVAPIAMRDLLMGKLLGLGVIGLGQLATTLPILALRRGPRPAELLWGLAAGAFALVVTSGLGHVLSAGLSRPVDARGRPSRLQGLAAVPASLLVLAAAGAPVLFVYGGSRRWGEWGPPFALWALAAAAFAGYRRALPYLARRVRALREAFLEAT